MTNRPERRADGRSKLGRHLVPPDAWLVLLVVVAVAGLMAAGTLDSINFRLAELLLPVSDGPAIEDTDVILVESRDETPDLVQTIRNLRRLDARLIAIVNLPADRQPGLFTEAQIRDDVVFVRGARSSRDDSADWLVDPLPPAAIAAGIMPAIGIVPLDRSSVRRRQPLTVSIDGLDQPTLESAIVQRVRGGNWNPEKSAYLIDYRGGLDALPRIEIERLLTGNIVRDLIAGRVVLVGLAARPDGMQLSAPAGLGVPWMTELEYHGFAVRTLLEKSRPSQLSFPIALLLVAGMLVAILLATRVTQGARLVWISICAALLIVGGGALAFAWSGLVLPIAAMLAALALHLILTMLRRAVSIEHTARRISREIAIEAHDQLQSAPLRGEHAPWRQIAAMATQILDIKHSVFFETAPDTTRLRIYVADQAGEKEMAEFGDYRNKPFSDALHDSGLTSTKGVFPADSQAALVEYLVPIRLGDEVLAFWGFALEDAQRITASDFQGLLRSFIDQAADFLFAARQQDDASPNLEPRQVLGWPIGAGGRGGDPEKTLKPLLEIQRHRHVLLENVLDGVKTAVIVYDAFGGLLHANNRMAALLQSVNIPIADLAPFDLITKITDTKGDNAKYYLRHVLLEEGTISIPVKLTIRERRYLLNISPIKYLPRGSPHGAHPSVSLLALLCEIIDITVIDQLTAMKDVLSEHLGHRLRNTIAGMFAAADLLTDPRSSEQMRAKIVTNLKQSLLLSKAAFERLETFLETPITPEVAQRYPVDLRAMLPRAVGEVSADAANRRITLDLQMPSTVSLVIAGAPGMATLAQTILRVLIQDAVEGSTISIILEEDVQTVVLKASNKGFGLPDKRLEALISGPDEPQSNEFRRLRAGAKDVAQWGGSFEATSVLGAGFTFRIALHKVL